MVILARYLIMIIVMRTFIWDEKHMIIMGMRYLMFTSTKRRCGYEYQPNILTDLMPTIIHNGGIYHGKTT